MGRAEARAGDAGAAAPVDVTGEVWPGPEEFLALAEQRRVIPVVRRLLADGDTPVTVYRKLAANRPGTFLLESAEVDGRWSRYSFVGVGSAAMLTEREGHVAWVGEVPAGVSADAAPTEALRSIVAELATEPIPGLPPFTSGMVGAISYDAVRRWERIPDANPREVDVPELAMLLATDVVVLDHVDGTVWLIANAVNFDGTAERAQQAYDAARSRVEAMTAALAASAAALPATLDMNAAADFSSRTPRPQYLASVERAKEHIRAGDAFQIVVSQRFDAPCPAAALDVYRVLRMTNPSPYMYLFRFPGATMSEPGFDVVGSSPEALVKVTQGRCLMHPIAGTRPRGETPQRDAELAAELLADEKERAEHLMLVDLGRNDLGRVCRAGSVDVVDFMTVERYSHVMHIVSTVEGDLAGGRTGFDALAATFPAGTLSGAPKPRAMEIIDDLEPARRGIYGGAVGYLDFAGNVDTAIAIRTAVVKDGVAYVQAGAGIVADSDPHLEDAECRNKAAAVLRAVAIAGSLSVLPELPDGGLPE